MSRILNGSALLMQDTITEEIKEEAEDLMCQNEVEMEQLRMGVSEENNDNQEEVMEPLLAVFLQPEEIEEVSVEEEDPLAFNGKSLVFDEDADKYCNVTKELVILGKSDSANEVGKESTVLQESFAKNFNNKIKIYSSRVNFEGASRIQNFSEEIQEIIKQNRIVCAICKKYFSNRCEWEEHVQEHTTPKTNSCKICKQPYSEKDYVCDHIRKSLQNQDFKCLICQESFSLKTDCVEHMKCHVKMRLCVCKICNKSFREKSLLQEHFRSHAERTFFECSICKKCFDYKSWWVRHMALHEKYKCKKCNESFSRKIVLEHHLRTHEGKDIECSICKQMFSSKRACSVHMRIHKEERHKCNICHKFFFGNVHVCYLVKTNTKQTICKPQVSSNNHKDLNTRKLYCYVCDKNFSSWYRFCKHKKLHFGIPYRCRECKECFSRYDMFFIHLSIHRGNKPFTCNTCQKKFSVKENLLRHMLTHTLDKPNECNTCHKYFSGNVDLLRHMLTHIRKQR